MLVTGGPFVQYALLVHGTVVVLGLSLAGKNCALTSTGMTAPVLSEKLRCPSTRKMLPISPLCDVMETQV